MRELTGIYPQAYAYIQMRHYIYTREVMGIYS